METSEVTYLSFLPLISPKVLAQFDYFEKLATLKIIVFGECMVGERMIQLIANTSRCNF